MIDDASEKKEETPEIVVESDDDDDKEEEEEKEKEEEEEEESSWDVLEKSEASGEDENERTMREERSDREAVVVEKKRVSLSPPASLDVGVDTGKKSGEENEGKGEEEEEEEEEEGNSSEKTTRKGEEGTEEDSDEFSDLGEESKSSDDDEAAAAAEEKKTALDSLKTEVHAFFHNARKNASRAPTAVTNAWRRLARDARRRFRDLLKRAKAFKDGLSEDDKNLLKAAGVLVGAIVTVNVSKAIIGGRSSAPFT